MVKADEIDADQLSKAVVDWTGYGSAMCPARNDSALASVFPVQIAAKLLPMVKGLEEAFYKSEAWKTATSLSKMGEEATADFRSQYPDLPGVIAEAFAWCYTFDYK